MNTLEFQLVSVVGVVDLAQFDRNINLGPLEIESIESQLGQTIRVGQAASSSGSGPRLVIQRQQLDMLLVPERIEVRSQASTFSPEIAKNMAAFFGAVLSQLGGLPWLRVGYNFILWKEMAESAIDSIANKFFKDDLGKILGNHDVKGGAAWVWLDMNGDTLWLKLQPHRDSLITNRIVVNSNVTVDLASDFPDEPTIATNLVKHWEQVYSVLKTLDT